MLPAAEHPSARIWVACGLRKGMGGIGSNHLVFNFLWCKTFPVMSPVSSTVRSGQAISPMNPWLYFYVGLLL